VARAEAARHHERGAELCASGEYSRAAREFERAYELVPDYQVLYDVGQARIRLGQYARAHAALTRYLAEGASQIPDDTRRRVEADLELIAQKTGVLDIQVDVVGAEIFVDDVRVGHAPLEKPLLLDAAEHRVTARRAGYQAHTVPVTLAGGDAAHVKLELEPQGAQRLVVQELVAKEKVAESNRNAWLWGTWTATGAFAVASGVTGALGVKAADELAQKRSELGVSRSELDSASRRSRTLLLAADVFGAMTILAGGAAVYVTLSKPGPEVTERAGKPPRRQVALAIKPSWVGFTGTY
jgi:hypothetical protein